MAAILDAVLDFENLKDIKTSLHCPSPTLSKSRGPGGEAPGSSRVLQHRIFNAKHCLNLFFFNILYSLVKKLGPFAPEAPLDGLR